MGPNGHRDLDLLELDPAARETMGRLHTLDRAPGAAPVFAARLLAELDTQIAAQDPRPARMFASLPVLAASGDGRRLDGRPAGPSPVSPAEPKWLSARWFSSQVATAALLVVTLLASLALVGGYQRARLIDIVPVRGVPGLPSAVPDPQMAHGLLTQITVPGLPAHAGYVGIERWRFVPHGEPLVASWRSGPVLIFVVTGQLTASLDQTSYVVRDMGRREPEPFTAAAAGRIAAGDVLLVPANATVTASSDEAAPATALVVPIVSGDALDWQVWSDNTKTVAVEDLVSFWSEFAPGPARVELSRTTLQPGEQLPVPDSGAFRLVGAESKYLGYLRRSPDGSVTNLERTPLTVLIVTITQPYPSLAASSP